MKRFEKNQRVKVTHAESPFVGIEGTVTRCRMNDDGAWVNLDSVPEGVTRHFNIDDEYGRANHFLLYPDECEAVK